MQPASLSHTSIRGADDPRPNGGRARPHPPTPSPLPTIGREEGARGRGEGLCPAPQPPFITDFDVRQTPDLPEPPPRVPFRDPVFGTCLVRVTDRTADLSPDDASARLKNEYRVQSFNVDGSRILVRSIETNWYLYDAHTHQPLGQLPLEVDPCWEANDPNIVYFSQETRLVAYNIAAQQTTVVHEFANDFPGQTLAMVWSKYEGSPSWDGRYWGFMAEDQDWNTVAFLVYDQQVNR